MSIRSPVRNALVCPHSLRGTTDMLIANGNPLLLRVIANLAKRFDQLHDWTAVIVFTIDASRSMRRHAAVSSRPPPKLFSDCPKPLDGRMALRSLGNAVRIPIRLRPASSAVDGGKQHAVLDK